MRTEFPSAGAPASPPFFLFTERKGKWKRRRGGGRRRLRRPWAGSDAASQRPTEVARASSCAPDRSGRSVPLRGGSPWLQPRPPPDLGAQARPARGDRLPAARRAAGGARRAQVTQSLGAQGGLSNLSPPGRSDIFHPEGGGAPGRGLDPKAREGRGVPGSARASRLQLESTLRKGLTRGDWRLRPHPRPARSRAGGRAVPRRAVRWEAGPRSPPRLASPAPPPPCAPSPDAW